LMRHTICTVRISLDLHAMSHDELMKVHELDAAVVPAWAHTQLDRSRLPETAMARHHRRGCRRGRRCRRLGAAELGAPAETGPRRVGLAAPRARCLASITACLFGAASEGAGLSPNRHRSRHGACFVAGYGHAQPRVDGVGVTGPEAPGATSVYGRAIEAIRS
jgi:hypothetical protein